MFRRAGLPMLLTALVSPAAIAQTPPPHPPPATTPAATPATTPAAPSTLSIPVRRERLANGLRVVLSPDSSVPTVAVAIYYDVGSRVEEQGRSGFAHLFEHLMFEGTESLPKGEFDRLLSLRGADSNATTSEDRTNYFEMLPASSLELGLWLEADRMRALAITTSAFENQRQTVIEERRQSYENRPYMLSYLRRDELFYGTYFPYAHSTIGDMRDLEMPGVSPPDQLSRVIDFHRRYYAPDNAVLSVSGDFDPAVAMQMIERNFGNIHSQHGEAWHDPGFTPPGREITDRIEDAHAEAPGFHMAWHIPQRRTDDHYPLEILALVLGDGDSSRLYRSLVRDTEMLAELEVGTEDRRGPDIFSLWAICAGAHTPAEARAAVDAQIQRVLTGGITARELEKAKNSVRASYVFGLQRPLDRAEYLGMLELYDGDASAVNTELARYNAVTAADVQRVARQYLVNTNRIVLDVVPAPEPAAQGAPTPRP